MLLFSLQLVKIEDGVMDGEVMFHQFITKTDEEVKAIRSGHLFFILPIFKLSGWQICGSGSESARIQNLCRIRKENWVSLGSGPGPDV
jgi:hypothetical protein